MLHNFWGQDPLDERTQQRGADPERSPIRCDRRRLTNPREAGGNVAARLVPERVRSVIEKREPFALKSFRPIRPAAAAMSSSFASSGVSLI